MVDQSCSGRGCRFLSRLVDLVDDGVEAAIAFDPLIHSGASGFRSMSRTV